MGAALLGSERPTEPASQPESEEPAQTPPESPGGGILRNQAGAVPPALLLERTPLDPRFRWTVEVGLFGPAWCPQPVWDWYFIFGMLGGVWLGPGFWTVIFPSMAVPAGWYSGQSMLTLQWAWMCRTLRPEVVEGGFVSELLAVAVSADAELRCEHALLMLRVVQLAMIGLALVHLAVCYSLYDDPRVTALSQFCLVLFPTAMALGTFRRVSMMLLTAVTCEILTDQALLLRDRARSALSPQSVEAVQEAEAVLAAGRALGSTLGTAHQVLQPVLLKTTAWCISGACLFILIGVQFPPLVCAEQNVDNLFCALPMGFWFFLAACFGALNRASKPAICIKNDGFCI